MPPSLVTITCRMIATEALQTFAALPRRAATIAAFAAVAGVPNSSVALLSAVADASPGRLRRRLSGGQLTSLEFLMVAEDAALADAIHVSLSAQLPDAPSVATRLAIAVTTSPTVVVTPGVSAAAHKAGLAPVAVLLSSPSPPPPARAAWYTAWINSMKAAWSQLSLANKVLTVAAAVAIVMCVAAVAAGCYRKLRRHRHPRAIVRPKTFHETNQPAYQQALQKRRPVDPSLWHGSSLHSFRPAGTILRTVQPIHSHSMACPQLSNATYCSNGVNGGCSAFGAPHERSEEVMPAEECYPQRPSLMERVRERASSGMCTEWTPALRIYENLNEDGRPAPRCSPTRVRVSKHYTSGYV